MLLQLNIQNFAIVKSLELEWRKGMTTITGETGAGKSIAIDALSLCLGARAPSNVVRPNSNKAELSAIFDISHNQNAKTWLNQHDLLEDNECIVRRVISAEGRSRSYINGAQVPLTQLKELGHYLLHIHGQHDHQLITKTSEQRDMLDAFAEHQELIDDVRYFYQQWRQLNKEYEQLQQAQSEREAKQQLLQYQVQELDEFALQVDEFPQLEHDYKKYSNVQDLLSQSLATVQLLSESEHINVIDNLRRCIDSISHLAELDHELSDTANVLNEALIQIEEANHDLQHYVEKIDIDPESYQFIEERYSQALQLAKKHLVAPETLPELHLNLSNELALISGDENRLLHILDEIELSKAKYLSAAKKLSASRQQAAIELSKKITTSIQELNMADGQFQVVVKDELKEQIQLTGQDQIEFLVSLNPGQPLAAMHKVASGGELSRISLAMQVILADKIYSPTLIFDEVDVGISGPTAAMVGTKLQQLAQNCQIICVTHLPQVASKGHQQMFVAKLTDGEHTETTVTELSEQARIQEVARLLAGNKISEHSLANAKELLAS